MKDSPIIIVHLREPRSENDRRNRQDPFWEFGSFGLTRCHDKNLMNPDKIKELHGARLAFAQGGLGTMKLLLLTPPVKVKTYGRNQKRCELRWSPRQMPFRFGNAPSLVGNDSAHSKSGFRRLKQFVKKTRRPSWVAKFSSRFRSRREPLSKDLAHELESVYNRLRKRSREQFCRDYGDALPKPPQVALSRAKRKQEYDDLQLSARRSCNTSRPRRGC